MSELNCILIVDDNLDDNLFHQILLKDVCGFEGQLFQIDSGEKALVFLQQSEQAVDLILLDIHMPRMNGFEFLEAYRRLESHPSQDAVIVMLSTAVNPRDEEKIKGFTQVKDIMTKPFDCDKYHYIRKTYFS